MREQAKQPAVSSQQLAVQQAVSEAIATMAQLRVSLKAREFAAPRIAADNDGETAYCHTCRYDIDLRVVRNHRRLGHKVQL